MTTLDLTTSPGRDLLRGAVDLETTEHGLLPWRVPAWVRDRSDGQLVMAASQPSGVRLAFRTTATTIELLTVPTKRLYPGGPVRPDGVYDLLVDGQRVAQASAPGGHTVTVDLGRGTTSHTVGAPGTVRFDDVPRRPTDPSAPVDVEIWLPYDETTELVSLTADGDVEPLPARELTWLHHGSSISQGSVSASPSQTWVATAALAAGVDVVNLGLGGSMMLDPALARTMRDLPADLLSLEIGINIVNGDVMRLRAFTAAVHGFVDTLRDGHPETPLLLLSPIHCPIHEETPGPCEFDPAGMAEGRLAFRAAGDPADVAAGRLTLHVIRDELARIVAERDDPHLHLLDGRELYGPADYEAAPLPDELHPDAATQRVMGERFAALALAPGGPLEVRAGRLVG